jgi:hypothetical protein
MPRVAKGHVEQLPSGSWRARVYAGVDPITRREIRLKATAKTEQQAHIELGRQLVLPADARQLRSAALTGRLQPRTIVWLDEVQLFLSEDERVGLTADDLRALWARYRQVVVIGTMWPDLYDDMVLGPPPRGRRLLRPGPSGTRYGRRPGPGA